MHILHIIAEYLEVKALCVALFSIGSLRVGIEYTNVALTKNYKTDRIVYFI